MMLSNANGISRVFAKVGYCLICLVVISLSRCHSPPQDIYSIVPHKSKLTINILKKAEQIITYEKYLILTYDISSSWQKYDPHLLFFNEELKLSSACYFPSEQVDSIHNGAIYSRMNQGRNNRKSMYQNEIPSGFVLKYSYDTVGSIQDDELQIHRILPCNDFSRVNLVTSNSDTLVFQLSELHFNSSKFQIATMKMGNDKRVERNIMIISDSLILDNFYNQLWNSIISSRLSK